MSGEHTCRRTLKKKKFLDTSMRSSHPVLTKRFQIIAILKLEYRTGCHKWISNCLPFHSYLGLVLLNRLFSVYGFVDHCWSFVLFLVTIVLPFLI